MFSHANKLTTDKRVNSVDRVNDDLCRLSATYQQGLLTLQRKRAIGTFLPFATLRHHGSYRG
jgi:hypothetical protein